jgi:peptidyl-prolyl cis-trans isomerase B (cyclophilin B)
MEEVDNIVNAKRDYNDKPFEEQKIKSITVETFGQEYKEVEKM